ncbi:hypothetical protein BC829DRAFT_417563 [Chytridium lagenaria]|nr:hypothetical protein BC829DRAFT_417563 [Chytridium lagenaria]
MADDDNPDTVEALTVTIKNNKSVKKQKGGRGKGKGKNSKPTMNTAKHGKVAKGGYDNSIASTGHTYFELLEMSKPERLKACSHLTCHECNQRGHMRHDCPTQKKVGPTQTPYTQPTIANVASMDLSMVTVKDFLSLCAEMREKIPTNTTAMSVSVSKPKNDKPQEPKFGWAFITTPNPNSSTELELIRNLAYSVMLEGFDNTVTQWCFDTGLTFLALTRFKSDLVDTKPFHTQVDGAFAGQRSELIGKVKGFTNLGHKMEFKALYIPGIRVRLVSRSVLRAQGIFIKDGSTGTYLHNEVDKTDVAELIQSENELLILTVSPTPPRPPKGFPNHQVNVVDTRDFSSFHSDGTVDAVAIKKLEQTLEILHKSLGHPSNKVLKKILQNRQAYGIQGSKSLSKAVDLLRPCDTCSGGKSVQRTSKIDSTRYKLRRLQRIHFDIGFGPKRAPHKESTAVAIAVDSATGFTWVELLKTKDK